jgi:hypothetical protein
MAFQLIGRRYSRVNIRASARSSPGQAPLWRELDEDNILDPWLAWAIIA